MWSHAAPRAGLQASAPSSIESRSLAFKEFYCSCFPSAFSVRGYDEELRALQFNGNPTDILICVLAIKEEKIYIFFLALSVETLSQTHNLLEFVYASCR